MEKPREKLKNKGKKSLSRIELLAIILKTGTRNLNCLELSRKVLAAANNDLDKLGELSLTDLQAIYGVGETQAMVIMAAMELRQRVEPKFDSPKIVSPRDAFLRLREDLADLPHEEFWTLYLNRSSKLLLKKQISSGGISSTVVDPRIIFQAALDQKASSIIVAHNHPSGNLTPSQADIDLTRKLVDGGKLLGVQLVDHLILAGKNYCSFADSGLL